MENQTHDPQVDNAPDPPPCPFCGSDDFTEHTPLGKAFLSCITCGATTPLADTRSMAYETIENAIAWRRFDEVSAELEKTKDQLRMYEWLGENADQQRMRLTKEIENNVHQSFVSINPHNDSGAGVMALLGIVRALQLVAYHIGEIDITLNNRP